MSVSVQGFTVDPHTIRDQETQQPKPWTSIVSAEKANGLAQVLKARVEGEVRFDDMSRALYSTDASNYRQVPIGVVIPKTIDDVVTTIACCREYGAPFLSRGGGTSLCGQSCNAAVMADFSKYLNRIIGIDFEKKLARVQPGCNLDILRNAAEKHHLTFGPDPSTHDHNTLGGMMGNNSCGVHSVYAGRTADNVEELDIVTYRGLRLKVGRTSPSELRGIIAAGAARVKSTAASPRFATATPISSAGTILKFPGASPGTISTSCCPRTGSTSRARSSAPKEPASSSSKPR